MSEQFEGDAPLLTVAVERGGVLIDAHDQADAVLQILVGEGDFIANAEVGTSCNLWWRSQPGQLDICWCRATFGRRRSRLGEDRRVVHFEGLAVGRILYGHVVPAHPDDSCRAQLPVSPAEVLDLLAGMQLSPHLDDASRVGQ